MKHLFVTNDFAPKLGGIESYLSALLHGFDPADVVVVAPSRSGDEQTDDEFQFRVIRAPTRYLKGGDKELQIVLSAATDHHADAIHLMQTLPLGRLARKLKSKTNKFVSVFVYGSELIVPARLYPGRLAIRKVFQNVDRVFAISNFTRAAIAKVAPDANVSILEPVVDPKRFSPEISGASIRERLGLGSSFTVLFVSRLVKRKGAEIFVKALAQVPQVTGVIVGTGPEAARIREVASELNLAGRLILAGSVSDYSLPSWYAAADVFCMPCSNRYEGADTEGFGIVFLEAAATGLPCIAGVCGGSAEAVEDEKTGYVLSDPTEDSLAQYIERLRDDVTKRIEMGAAGRVRVERQFDPKVRAQQLEEVVGAARW